MLTPALYRTRITHLRRAPVHHYFEHRGYSWYVDIDRLPQLPRWLRPFARFDAARPLLDGAGRTTHCGNASTPSSPSAASTCTAADHRADAGAGAGLRVQPVDALSGATTPQGVAAPHRRRSAQHLRRQARLPAAAARRPARRWCAKKLYVSPFNDVDGYYLVSRSAAGRRTGRARSRCTATTSRRSSRRCAAPGEAPASASSLKLQLVAPLAPLMGAIGIRVQGITLWLRRVPVVPRPESIEKERVHQL